MYLLVIPPTPPPPPPSLACQWLNLGCPPPPAPVNPDSLQQLEPYLASEVDAPTWTGAFTKPSGMTGMGEYEHERYQYLFHPRLTTNRTIGGKKDCGCGCGGGCSKGMGLFDSGTDFSGWGMPEWTIVGLTGVGALYAMSALVSGGRRVASGVRSYRRRK